MEAHAGHTPTGQMFLAGQQHPTWLERTLLFAILGVFLTLALPQLSLPGLHPDEAQEVIPAVQLLRGQPVETLRGSGVTVFGQGCWGFRFSHCG